MVPVTGAWVHIAELISTSQAGDGGVQGLFVSPKQFELHTNPHPPAHSGAHVGALAPVWNNVPSHVSPGSSDPFPHVVQVVVSHWQLLLQYAFEGGVVVPHGIAGGGVAEFRLVHRVLETPADTSQASGGLSTTPLAPHCAGRTQELVSYAVHRTPAGRDAELQRSVPVEPGTTLAQVAPGGSASGGPGSQSSPVPIEPFPQISVRTHCVRS